MFKHLLIPLDGSHLAEAALGPAAWLARILGAKVTLAHFIECSAPQAVHGERHLTDREEATRYLGDVAQRFFGKKSDVLFHVHAAEVDDVAESIVEHAREFGADLVVMCAHGKRGLKRIVVGSIAQRVIGEGRCPVLLLQPNGASTKPDGFRRIMVPIDGDPEHERVVGLADELARALGAALHLLTVVPTLGTLAGSEAATGIMLPGATSELLAMAETSARTHLAELAHAGGTAPGTIAVRRGDPAQQIVAEAVEESIDLIVLASHGKAGMSAFWSGSVAPHIPSLTRLPLLLVPVHRS